MSAGKNVQTLGSLHSDSHSGSHVDIHWGRRREGGYIDAEVVVHTSVKLQEIPQQRFQDPSRMQSFGSILHQVTSEESVVESSHFVSSSLLCDYRHSSQLEKLAGVSTM